MIKYRPGLGIGYRYYNPDDETRSFTIIDIVNGEEILQYEYDNGWYIQIITSPISLDYIMDKPSYKKFSFKQELDKIKEE